MSSVDIAAELQAVGGGLSAGLDPDRLLVTGNALAGGLDRMLEILAAVLTDADVPGRGGGHRAGPAGRPHPGRAEPAGAPGPDGAAQADVRPPPVRGADARAGAGPGGPPGAAARPARRPGAPGRRGAGAGRRHQPGEGDRRGRARRWAAGPAPGRDGDVPPTPALRARPAAAGRPARLGAVVAADGAAGGAAHRTRTTPRCSWPTWSSAATSRPAGWRTSARTRATRTARTPRSSTSWPARRWSSAAEVATEVTGPALLETLYELGRIASLPPGEEELEQARRYALGTLRLGMSTQAGLAGLASMYASFGLRLDYLRRALGRAGRGDPRARWPRWPPRYLAPSRAVTVVLGDADAGRGAAGRADRRWSASDGMSDAEQPDVGEQPGDVPPLARTTLDRAALHRAGRRRGWPRPGSAAWCWSSTSPAAAAALVRDRPDGGAELVLLDAADGARRRAAVPRRRPGRHAAVRGRRRRCRPIEGARRGRRCARSGTCSTTGTPGCSPPRRRWATGTPRTGSRRAPGSRPRSSRAAGSRIDRGRAADVAAHRPGDDRAGARRRAPGRTGAACSATTRAWPARRTAAGASPRLAGFVEPGESAEAAVAREVLEEVGVRRPRRCGTWAARRGRTRAR